MHADRHIHLPVVSFLINLADYCGLLCSLERDVEAAKHATEAERKHMEDLAHERDILNKLRTQVS